MRSFDETLNLLILYDAARGFLPLRNREAVLSHALFSLAAACGTGRALYFARLPDGRLEAHLARGAPMDSPLVLPLGIDAESRLVQDSGPYAGRRLDLLGSDLRPALEDQGLVLLAGVAESDRLFGAVALGGRRLGEAYTETELSLVHEISALTATALARLEATGTAPEPLAPDGDITPERLRRDHPALRPIVGDGPATLALFEELLVLADFDLPVLISGETGTGKELVARALHELSPRRAAPFEALNCAAIPRDLVSSALFGHEKGAFTGAIADARGAFERAGAGTIFLDEIGDMPLEVQASLLRVLQERRFSRVGGDRLLPAQARVISATNHDLKQAVQAGSFRADLFYRIQMYSIQLPPLRERRGEIPALVEHILDRVRRTRASVPAASPRFLRAIESWPLPGNVRELEGLVLSAVIRARGSATLEPVHLPPAAVTDPPSAPPAEAPSAVQPAQILPYDDMEREYIRSVLRLTDGNKAQAAALMKIPRTTLNERIKKLGLDSES